MTADAGVLGAVWGKGEAGKGGGVRGQNCRNGSTRSDRDDSAFDFVGLGVRFLLPATWRIEASPIPASPAGLLRVSFFCRRHECDEPRGVETFLWGRADGLHCVDYIRCWAKNSSNLQRCCMSLLHVGIPSPLFHPVCASASRCGRLHAPASPADLTQTTILLHSTRTDPREEAPRRQRALCTSGRSSACRLCAACPTPRSATRRLHLVSGTLCPS